MKMITFDKQYFNDLESANYFGDDGSELQANVRFHWIDRMRDKGYQLGSDYDENDSQFEADCQLCMDEAMKLASA